MQINGLDKPIVQIVNESTDETEYTLRLNKNTWQPKVFSESNYTILVGDQNGQEQKVEGVLPGEQGRDDILTFHFQD